VQPVTAYASKPCFSSVRHVPNLGQQSESAAKIAWVDDQRSVHDGHAGGSGDAG
jgi:hypothetical protein